MIGRRALLGALVLAGCRPRARSGPEAARADATLRVMTLNVAHGRARALVQSRARTKEWFARNLDAIATVIVREDPDVVALQEAELGSRWAGDFDHVAYLARACGLSAIAATPHMRVDDRFRYGTALLARMPWIDHAGHDFTAQSRWKKGWTSAALQLAGARVTAISVHLDFASAARRRAQAHELADAFADHEAPLVVLGDFNAQWHDEQSPVAAVADALALHTVAGAPTYGRRHLDWILASSRLRFVDHRVLDDRLSDHRAVVADLAFATSVTTSSRRSISSGCT